MARKKSTKAPKKAEEIVQPEPELTATASNSLKPSTMSGTSADEPEEAETSNNDTANVSETSGKRRGNNRERTADNDVKLQIRVSPEVAEILGKAAAARRCPLSNYCAILLTDWALESDATPRLSPEEQAKAEAIYKAMFGDK